MEKQAIFHLLYHQSEVVVFKAVIACESCQAYFFQEKKRQKFTHCIGHVSISVDRLPLRLFFSKFL